MSKETINITLDHFKPKAAPGYGWRNNSEDYMKLHFTVEVLDKDGNEIVNKKFRGYGTYPYKSQVEIDRITDELEFFMVEEIRSTMNKSLFIRVCKTITKDLIKACDDSEIGYWGGEWDKLHDQKLIREIPLKEIHISGYPTKYQKQIIKLILKDKSLLEDQEIGRSVIKFDAKAGYNWVKSTAITEDEYFEIIDQNHKRVFTKTEVKFLADKGPYIKCTNDNIKQIVKEQIELLGNEADLNHLNVSKVTDMEDMFKDSQFNGDISKWNMGNVNSMRSMFPESKFNGDISSWDVSNVTDMNYLFRGSEFNRDISGWDVSNVTDMVMMFRNSKFDGDISEWDIGKVTRMGDMFSGSQFNGDISGWDVSNVTDMGSLFYSSKFNGDISKWNVGIVRKVNWMFKDSQFNGDISSWDVGNVTDMTEMFSGSKFNGEISSWDVSNVTDMKKMFSYSKFNGDISSWDVGNVADMYAMFYDSKFAEDVSGWDIGHVGNVDGMFKNCPIPEENKLKFDLPVESGPYIKCASYNIKQIVKEQIELLGNEADLNHLDVSSVTNMSSIFFSCSQFTGDISKWVVNNVTDMDKMFSYSQFTGDISSWDVGNVTNMRGMFSDSQFTGDISSWGVSNVTDMSRMFKNCPIPEENKPKFED